ncbi:MAG: hypothetical protein [Caudoviricetes sp.]|nr:MAG: hypothetical protein [Caudoviricetes sp.]
MFTFLLYFLVFLVLCAIILWYFLIAIIVLGVFGLLIYLVTKVYNLIADEIRNHKENKYQDKD